MQELLNRFWSDDQVQIFAFLIVLDLALGVTAALKDKTFRLAYLADFARNDIAFKAIPALILYGGYVYADNSDIVIPGLDMQVIARGAIALAMGALIGSLLKSLRDFGFLEQTTHPQAVDAIAGPDPEAKL